MPELPEVEVIRQGLSDLLPGRVVKDVQVFNSPKSFPNPANQVKQFLCGAKVSSVKRRAKLLLVHLDSNYSLLIHLKMTGQLVFRGNKEFGGGHPSDSLINKLPDRSTRVEIDFDDGSKLFFNDQRKFGWIKLLPTDEIAQVPFIQKLGPEPLDTSTKPQEFIQRIRRHDRAMMKPSILDQGTIAGVGNIYADESLWDARIHPETRVHSVSDKDLAQLFTAIKKVFKKSIANGGSTARNYINANGERGKYLDFANVYGREGLPCHRHPYQMIIKIRVAGRGTYICPLCQVKVVE